MNETEVGNLVVRLTGDASSYEKMLAEAGRKAAESKEALEAHQAITKRGEEITRSVMTAEEKHAEVSQELGKLLDEGAISQEIYNRAMERSLKTTEEQASVTEKASEAMKQLGMNLLVVGAVLTAAFGGMAHQAFEEWGTAEITAIKLSAAIEANGREVQSTLKDYQDFATAQEQLTTIGDDTTLMQVKQAESFGLTGDAAKKAVKDAQALASINDSSAEAMIRITAAMAEGDTERAMMFSRMIPQLRGVKDEAEFTAKFMALVAAGEKTMAEETKTAAGQIAQLKNDFGNFLEEIGAVISEGLLPVIAGLKELVHWLQGQSQWVKVSIAVTLGLGAGLGILVTAIGGCILAYQHLIATTMQYVTATNAARASSVGLQLALAGLAVYGVMRLSDSLTGADAAAKKFSQRMTELEEQQQRFAASYQARTQTILQQNATAADLERANEDVARYQRRLEDAKEMQRQVAEEDARQRALSPGTTAMEDMFRSLTGQNARPQVQALEGVNAQVKRTEQALKLAKERAQEFSKQLDPKQLSKGLVREIDELVKGLELQAQTFGMTGEEAAIYQLQLRGATEESLANARATLRMIEAQRKDQQAKEEAELALQRLMDEGKAITERLQTPMERFETQVASLTQMLYENAISADTFNRGIDDARKNLDETTKSAAKAHAEITRFDAALAGSAEAATRIEAYKDLLQGMSGGTSAGGAVAAAGAQTPKAEVVVASNAETAKSNQEQTTLMRQIAENTAKAANKSTLVIAPAELEGTI